MTTDELALFDTPEASPPRTGHECPACGGVNARRHPRDPRCERCARAGIEAPSLLGLGAGTISTPGTLTDELADDEHQADEHAGPDGRHVPGAWDEGHAMHAQYAHRHGLAAVAAWSQKIHGDRDRRHAWCMAAAVAIVEGHELPPTGKGTAYTLASTAAARVETIRTILARYDEPEPAPELTPREAHRARCSGVMMAPIFGMGRTSCGLCDWSPTD